MDDRDGLIEQLQLLGLTQYESEVYVTLLGQPVFTASEVAAQSGVPRQRVYDVLERLCAHGLATELADRQVRTFAAVEPAAALSTWLEHERRQMEAAYTKQSAQVQDLIPELKALVSSTRDLEVPPNVLEQISDPFLFTRRITDSIGTAHSTHDRMTQSPFIITLEEQLRQIDDACARGLHVRALYDRTAADDRGILAYLHLFRENGADVRLADSMPATLYLIDSQHAWLAVPRATRSEDSYAMFTVPHAGIAALLTAAFDRFWEQASPLT